MVTSFGHYTGSSRMLLDEVLISCGDLVCEQHMTTCSSVIPFVGLIVPTSLAVYMYIYVHIYIYISL